MKKIALCLHGQLRDYHKAIESWIEFVDKYQPDIYWHAWDRIPVWEPFDRKLQAGLVEKCEDFDYHGVTQYASTALNVGPQFLSINTCLNLLKKPYDFIVRSRWDLVLHNPTALNFDQLDPTQFYVTGNHWQGHQDTIDDNIMVSSGDNICFHNGILWYLTTHWLDNLRLIPSGEQLISSYFKEEGLMKRTHKIPELNFTLCRNLS